MSTVEAIVLGITQGLTEFLPISSSAHLIIVPWLFGWDEPGLAFDAALHLGTLVAVLAYFRRDLLAMLRAVPRALRSPLTLLGERSEVFVDPESRSARLLLLIFLGSIPGGIAGLAAEGIVDDFFHDASETDRAIVLAALFLIVFGLILLWVDRHARHRRSIDDTGWRDALALGAAQALALLPGVSRSGVTLTAGLVRELKRADAARFSFLLGIPLVTIAGFKGIADIAQSHPTNDEKLNLIIGLVASALSGLIAIWALLRYLQRSSTTIFVLYRVLLGSSLILLVLSGFR
jgi:undecaprenyl-diphosphatase